MSEEQEKQQNEKELAEVLGISWCEYHKTNVINCADMMHPEEKNCRHW